MESHPILLGLSFTVTLCVKCVLQLTPFSREVNVV
jgi:hypothetical protein